VRVAILTEIISPYRIPVFNHLAANPEIDLKVIFASETEGLRHWRVAKEQIRFDYEVLPGWAIARTYQNASLFFNPTIIQTLHRGRFDIVIFGGYQHPSYWMALAYCKLMGKDTILWSESTLKDFRIQSGLRNRVKKLLINVFNRYVVPGTAQRDYLLSFSRKTDAIWTAPNAVDVDFFSKWSEEYRQQKETLKTAMDIEGDVILFVGRLIDEKGLGDLLHAFEQVSQNYKVTLLIVGSGQQEQQYREYVEQHRLPVIFAGFQQQEDLPRYYAIADVFAFPTHTDPWGLVLNEAMSSSLPVIVSTAAGAANDLVKPGWNGYIHASGDTDGLVHAMKSLLNSPELRVEMGYNSRRMIEAYTPEKCAEGFVNMLLKLRKDTFSE